MTRNRSISSVTGVHPWISSYQWGPPGSETSPTTGTFTYYENAECTDEVHRYPYRSGGPLLIKKSRRTATPSQSLRLKNGYLRFEGRLHAKTSWNRDFPWVSTWDNDLFGDNADDNAATGWNRFVPGRPDASLAQFIGEIREAPRMLQVRARNLKDVGSGYLNYQFGWRPFLRDLKHFYRAHKKLANRLQQLKRDNGRPIRRRGIIKQTTSSVSSYEGSSYGYFYPTFTTGFYKSVPTLHRVTDVDSKHWFSGRFRYWIPDIGTPAWERRATRLLFGGGITPHLVWELMPWSWLIDWHTNIGDILENISGNAAENLTADYAYSMYSHEHRIRRYVDGSFKDENGLTVTAKATDELNIIWKQRVAASSFGFAIDEADYSTRQWFILGALGLTRT